MKVFVVLVSDSDMGSTVKGVFDSLEAAELAVVTLPKFLDSDGRRPERIPYAEGNRVIRVFAWTHMGGPWVEIQETEMISK